MTDYVIDANVWINAGKSVIEFQSEAELECYEATFNWITQFVDSEDRLLVDWDYRILGEYRRNAPERSQLAEWLNQLERKPRRPNQTEGKAREPRLVEVQVQWDENGYALVPEDLMIHDESDRVYVAVAVAHSPRPPIVYSTETDWRKEKEKLERGGIVLHELCPAYIDEHYKG